MHEEGVGWLQSVPPYWMPYLLHPQFTPHCESDVNSFHFKPSWLLFCSLGLCSASASVHIQLRVEASDTRPSLGDGIQVVLGVPGCDEGEGTWVGPHGDYHPAKAGRRQSEEMRWC